jgi:hypothetical protein
MKVFISWSGERSRAVAVVLRDWLPSVIQSVRPWLSLADMDKGARWRTEIADQLEQCQVGIICLTPENLDSHWLLFEAGALSKISAQSYVCTFLYDLEYSDVSDPLAQFQHTVNEKEDIKSLLKTINGAQGDAAISETQLERVFEWGWEELDSRLKFITQAPKTDHQEKSEKEMLKELLDYARSEARERAQSRSLTDDFLTTFLPIFESAAHSEPKIRLTPAQSAVLAKLKFEFQNRPTYQRQLIRNWWTHNQPSIFEYVDPPFAWASAEHPNSWAEVTPGNPSDHSLNEVQNVQQTPAATETSKKKSIKRSPRKQ